MKRILPVIFAASLALSGCSKSSSDEPIKQIEETKTPEQVLVAKYLKILPELKDFAVLAEFQVSADGQMAIAGLNKDKYIFALVSPKGIVEGKLLKDLESELKDKFKYIYVRQEQKSPGIYYFTLNAEKDKLFPDNVKIINQVEDKLYEIGGGKFQFDKNKNFLIVNKTKYLVGVEVNKKLWIFSNKGELLNSYTSYDLGDNESRLIINKDQVVSISIPDNFSDKFYLQCLLLHKPFGERTVVWAKSYQLLKWIRKSGEERNVNIKYYDDIDNVIVEYSAVGRKYDSKGDLVNHSENGFFRLSKSTGELVK